MKVQVISIEFRDEWGEFDVDVLVGVDYYTFKIEVTVTKIDQYHLQTASSGRYFADTLQHHPGVMNKIYQLVFKVYNNEEVELPVTVIEHLPISPVFAGHFRQAAFAN